MLRPVRQTNQAVIPHPAKPSSPEAAVGCPQPPRSPPAPDRPWRTARTPIAPREAPLPRLLLDRAAPTHLPPPERTLTLGGREPVRPPAVWHCRLRCGRSQLRSG